MHNSREVALNSSRKAHFRELHLELNSAQNSHNSDGTYRTFYTEQLSALTTQKKAHDSAYMSGMLVNLKREHSMAVLRNMVALCKRKIGF